MSLSTIIRSELREGHNRLILQNKQSLKALFLEVQRGHQAEIEIMRIFLESCGVFDEAKENITQEDGSMELETADSMNIGQGVLDYVSERELNTDVAASTPTSSIPLSSHRNLMAGKKLFGRSDNTCNTGVAASTPTSSIPPSSHRNLMVGKKLFGRSDKTSVSTDNKLSTNAVRPTTVPLTSRRSRLQRQATPIRRNNEKLLKANRVRGKFRNRNPASLGTGVIHTNSHIEEKKEHSEEASAVINPENKSNIRVSDPQSQHGEPSYSSLYSPSVIEKSPALFKRKEGHSSIISEEKALTDDSDTDVVHSRAVNVGSQNRNKNSLSSNLSSFANTKIENVRRVPNDNYKSEHQHIKLLKPKFV